MSLGTCLVTLSSMFFLKKKFCNHFLFTWAGDEKKIRKMECVRVVTLKYEVSYIF